MRLKPSLFVLSSAAVVGSGVADARADNILSPNDTIIAVDNNRNRPGNTNTTNPDTNVGEGPDKLFDGADALKWLSFGRSFAGVIVTLPNGAAAVRSLQFTAANDAPERDPVSYQLFGRNGTVTTVNNGTGLEDAWTLIGGGPTNIAPSNAVATDRNTTVAPTNITNATSYTSYKVVLTKLRAANAGIFDPVLLTNGATPNSVQLGELRLFDAADGGGTNVADSASAVVAFDQTDSFFPSGERPVEVIDRNKTASSKYLNFGREGAGFIATLAGGPKVARSFQITTANDAEVRDPSAYEIYGTNAPIQSLEDSAGTGEAWTLITSGSLALPAARNADGGIIGFENSTAYASYKVIFTDNKGPDADGAANSIQLSEFELFDTAVVPEPASIGLLGVAVAGLLGRRRHRR